MSKEWGPDTNRWWRVGATVLQLAESPVGFVDLAVGELDDMADHLNHWQLLGQHLAWVPATAHVKCGRAWRGETRR